MQVGLEDVAYESGRFEFHRPRATEPESVLPRYLEDASRIVSALELSPPASADVPGLSPVSRRSAGFRCRMRLSRSYAPGAARSGPQQTFNDSPTRLTRGNKESNGRWV